MKRIILLVILVMSTTQLWSQSMFIYPKKLESQLCIGLTLGEFRCKCGFASCKATIINPLLLSAYKILREKTGHPLTILSGFRCARHNFKVDGADLSQHQLGSAIDIAISSLEDVGIFKQDAYDSGFVFMEYHEDKKFIHLDTRSTQAMCLEGNSKDGMLH